MARILESTLREVTQVPGTDQKQTEVERREKLFKEHYGITSLVMVVFYKEIILERIQFLMFRK